MTDWLEEYKKVLEEKRNLAFAALGQYNDKNTDWLAEYKKVLEDNRNKTRKPAGILIKCKFCGVESRVRSYRYTCCALCRDRLIASKIKKQQEEDELCRCGHYQSRHFSTCLENKCRCCRFVHFSVKTIDRRRRSQKGYIRWDRPRARHEEVTCPVCKSKFNQNNTWHVYCTATCRYLKHRRYK